MRVLRATELHLERLTLVIHRDQWSVESRILDPYLQVRVWNHAYLSSASTTEKTAQLAISNAALLTQLHFGSQLIIERVQRALCEILEREIRSEKLPAVCKSL